MIHYLDIAICGNCSHTLWSYDSATHIETSTNITGQQLVKFCRAYRLSMHTHFMKFTIGESDPALEIPNGQIGDSMFYSQTLYEAAK